ncbi:hypothetical protein R1flu_028933 [Riccia fluitans]|uniref:Uncharacterized protein n=1 Tax=Riccia fluitans TaxID=41844 RepID=A0ABD1XNM9_9MARC
MDKSGWSWSGCSRRRFLLLMLFQLIAMCMIYTTVQYFWADGSLWLPHGSIPQEWELSEVSETKSDEVLSLADDGVKKENHGMEGTQFLPYQNDLTRKLEQKNREPPRNRDLFHNLQKITFRLFYTSTTGPSTFRW